MVTCNVHNTMLPATENNYRTAVERTTLYNIHTPHLQSISEWLIVKNGSWQMALHNGKECDDTHMATGMPSSLGLHRRRCYACT